MFSYNMLTGTARDHRDWYFKVKVNRRNTAGIYLVSVISTIECQSSCVLQLICFSLGILLNWYYAVIQYLKFFVLLKHETGKMFCQSINYADLHAF